MNFQKTFLILAFVSIVLFGCKKKVTANDPSDGKGTMSATIDGVDWKAVKITLALWAGGQLHVKGEAADGSLIQISMLDVPQTGIYPVGAASSANIAAYVNSNGEGWQTSVLTPEGTVDVNALSSAGTKGTFSFIGSDAVIEKKITNGKFDVKF
jgi:hypothetical protein